MSDTPRVLGGRYEVGELIGRGGMAEVHLGHDTRLGRQVAIKMLRADLARDHTFLTRFRREAQSAAGLNHHAVVAVYDSGEDVFIESGGARVEVPYIVMEFVDGQTLRELLNDEGRLAPDEAGRITMGILAALEYSHNKGLVHRDIKPGNVMISRGGSVKVMDFGIARALEDAGATMTSAQAVVGTARYLSPEQAQGETVDERSDLYSTGCVLFELLTGRTPFVGEPVSLVYQHIQDAPSAPSSYEPSVPDSMDAVALHALEKPRDGRYQDARSFREDLQRARTGEPVSAAALASAAAAGRTRSSTPPVSDTPARRDATADMATGDKPKHSGLWILAGLVALAAILGIGYAFMRDHPSDPQTRSATVPSVLQQPRADAERILRENSFVPRAETVTNDAPEGTVVDQDPRGGSSVPAGSEVGLSVSSGPGQIAMPDLRGKTEQQARDELKRLKFPDSKISIAQQRQDDTKYARDQVASTSPAAGTQVATTQSITLRLSSGQVQVPGDLLGKQVTDAAIELNGLGLKLRQESIRVSNPSQVGKVVDVPQAGDKVAVGSEVTVKVGVSAPVTQTQTATPTPSSTSSEEPSPSESPSSSPSEPSSTRPVPTPTTTASPGDPLPPPED